MKVPISEIKPDTSRFRKRALLSGCQGLEVTVEPDWVDGGIVPEMILNPVRTGRLKEGACNRKSYGSTILR